MARRIFLRLVQFNEGRPHTRRQLIVDKLKSATDKPAAFDDCLRHLTDNRLLTLDGDSVEKGKAVRVDISHEILITAWPLLQSWIFTRHEAEQLRRRLEDKAVEWQRLGGRALLDEVEVQEAEQWLKSSDGSEQGHSQELEKLIEQSQIAIDQEKQEKETARQREFDHAHKLAEAQKRELEDAKRLAKRQRLIIAVSAFASVILFVSGYFLIKNRNETIHQLANNFWANGVAARNEHDHLRYLYFVGEALQNSKSKKFNEFLLLDAQSSLSEIGLKNVLEHEERIIGALFNKDGSRILTWSTDGKIMLRSTESDLDLPVELFLPQIKVLTGTSFDINTQQIYFLRFEEWQQQQKEYEREARKHYQVCKYPKVNLWALLNPGEAKKLRPELF